MPIRIVTHNAALIEPFVPTGAPHLHAWSSDPDTTRYMGWKRRRSVAEARKLLWQLEDAQKKTR